MFWTISKQTLKEINSLDKLESLMAAILAEDNCTCIFMNENDRIPIRISRKFVPSESSWQ